MKISPVIFLFVALTSQAQANTYLSPLAGGHYVLASVLIAFVIVFLLLVKGDHPRRKWIFGLAVVLLVICFPAYPFMRVYQSGFYNLMSLLYWALLLKVMMECVQSNWGISISVVLVLLIGFLVVVLVPAKVIHVELQPFTLKLDSERSIKNVFVEVLHKGYKKCPIGIYIVHASPRGRAEIDYHQAQWLNSQQLAEFPKGDIATECSLQELVKAKTTLSFRLLHPELTSQQKSNKGKSGQWHLVGLTQNREKSKGNNIHLQPVLFTDSLEECLKLEAESVEIHAQRNEKTCSFLLLKSQIKGLEAYMEQLNNNEEIDKASKSLFTEKYSDYFEQLIISNLYLTVEDKQELQNQLRKVLSPIMEKQ